MRTVGRRGFLIASQVPCRNSAAGPKADSKSGFRSNDLPSGHEHLHIPASSEAAAPDRPVAIDESRRHRPVFNRRVRVAPRRRIEFRFASRTREAGLFLAPFSSLPFDDACARKCAEIRRALERKGELIGPHDLQIAAVARRHDLTLVTHHTREFSRIVALRLEDWE
jgi:predicted nucleic acid-binding protein